MKLKQSSKYLLAHLTAKRPGHPDTAHDACPQCLYEAAFCRPPAESSARRNGLRMSGAQRIGSALGSPLRSGNNSPNEGLRMPADS